MTASPAERLLAAADLLDKRASEGSGPYSADRLWAVVLRTEAKRVDRASLTLTFHGSPLQPASPELLAVADLLLAGEPQ